MTDYINYPSLSGLQRLLMFNDLINIPNTYPDIIADKRKRLLEIGIPTEHVDYLCKPKNTASEPIKQEEGQDKWAALKEVMVEMYA